MLICRRSPLALVSVSLVLLSVLCPARAALPRGSQADVPRAPTWPARALALLPPVTPACISSPFGPRILPNRPLAGRFHPGIDLPAPIGAPVRATAPGQVVRVQHKDPGGLEILVQHEGFVGVYSHLGMIAPLIAEGKTRVAAGETLGVVGLTGVTYGMHLYFGMIMEGRPIDPAAYLNVPPCGQGGAPKAPPVSADGRIRPTRWFAGLD
jgi:murein DD-endopeptidase MepM/ murein hydrolase activator NlpD